MEMAHGGGGGSAPVATSLAPLNLESYQSKPF